MENNENCILAGESRMLKHLYLRGNFQQDMFYDKVDMINVWNRLWLSAKATGVQIASAVILNNHLHLSVIYLNDEQLASFKHHFRLSITQYHNKRYSVRGTLGTRTFKHAPLIDADDIKDCVCYHLRNVLHHGITGNYLDYPFSTVRFVFDLSGEYQQGYYTQETLPENLSHAFLPARELLPKGWMMSRDGMIVPPAGVFRPDLVEALFGNSRETYLKTLTQCTTRESSDHDEPCTHASDSRNVQSLDEKVLEFIKGNFRIHVRSMSLWQKMIAIVKVREEFPNISYKTLERIFGIPATTIRYRIRKM